MRYLLISALAGLLAGQPSPHFEVASIRVSADPVPGQTGAGPMDVLVVDQIEKIPREN